MKDKHSGECLNIGREGKTLRSDSPESKVVPRERCHTVS